MKKLATVLFAFAAAVALASAQQTTTPDSKSANPADLKDEGLPVTSELVKQKCSSCHKADDKGRMTRISYRRTTPEGWEETIKRMVSLNSVKLEPSRPSASPPA